MRARLLTLFTAALVLFAGEVLAQAKPSFPAGSLGEKILQRGQVIVGVRYDIPPY